MNGKLPCNRETKSRLPSQARGCCSRQDQTPPSFSGATNGWDCGEERENLTAPALCAFVSSVSRKARKQDRKHTHIHTVLLYFCASLSLASLFLLNLSIPPLSLHHPPPTGSPIPHTLIISHMTDHLASGVSLAFASVVLDLCQHRFQNERFSRADGDEFSSRSSLGMELSLLSTYSLSYTQKDQHLCPREE